MKPDYRRTSTSVATPTSLSPDFCDLCAPARPCYAQMTGKQWESVRHEKTGAGSGHLPFARMGAGRWGLSLSPVLWGYDYFSSNIFFVCT
jgi:hypothetical protein